MQLAASGSSKPGLTHPQQQRQRPQHAGAAAACLRQPASAWQPAAMAAATAACLLLGQAAGRAAHMATRSSRALMKLRILMGMMKGLRLGPMVAAAMATAAAGLVPHPSSRSCGRAMRSKGQQQVMQAQQVAGVMMAAVWVGLGGLAS